MDQSQNGDINENLDLYRTRLRSSATVKDGRILSNDKENAPISIETCTKIAI